MMLQTIQSLVIRFSGWLEADPRHGDQWTSLGFALIIAWAVLLFVDYLGHLRHNPADEDRLGP